MQPVQEPEKVNALWHNLYVLKLLLNIDQLLQWCLCALPVYCSFVLLVLLFMIYFYCRFIYSVPSVSMLMTVLSALFGFIMSVCDFLFNLCCLCLSCDGVQYGFLTTGGYIPRGVQKWAKNNRRSILLKPLQTVSILMKKLFLTQLVRNMGQLSSFFSSAGWADSMCRSVAVCVCLCVNQACASHIQTCYPTCIDLQMNSDHETENEISLI